MIAAGVTGLSRYGVDFQLLETLDFVANRGLQM